MESRPRTRKFLGGHTTGVETSPDSVPADYEVVRGTDFLVPRREVFAAYGADLPYDVIFAVGFDGVTSPVIDVRYRMRPDTREPVTATRVREVPLDQLVREAILRHRSVFRRVAPDQLRAVPDAERVAAYEPEMVRGRYSGRRRIADEDLVRVAEVYRLAVARGAAPTAAVQRELQLPTRNTAKKWVKRARELRFLQPAPGERRGGLTR